LRVGGADTAEGNGARFDAEMRRPKLSACTAALGFFAKAAAGGCSEGRGDAAPSSLDHESLMAVAMGGLRRRQAACDGAERSANET